MKAQDKHCLQICAAFPQQAGCPIATALTTINVAVAEKGKVIATQGSWSINFDSNTMRVVDSLMLKAVN